MTKPAILVFAGSIRTGSINEKLAANAAEAIAEAGGDVTKISLADYPMPIYNGDLEEAEGVPENGKKLAELFVKSQGIFIAGLEFPSFIPLLDNDLRHAFALLDDADAEATGKSVPVNATLANHHARCISTQPQGQLTPRSAAAFLP